MLELEQHKDYVCEVGGGIESFRGLNAPLSLQSRYGGVAVEIPASLGAHFPHTTDLSPLEGAIL